MALKLFYIIICTIFLKKDFKKIKGKFIKAKLFHSIIATSIIVVFSDTIPNIAKLIFNSTKVLSEWGENLNKIETLINLLNNIAYLILGIFMLFMGVGLINRSNEVRKIFIKLIIYFIPITTISVYMTAVKRNLEPSSYYLILGLISSIILFGLISFLYKRQFMEQFFNAKPEIENINCEN